MVVLVSGGRNFNDSACIWGELDRLNPSKIIHGGAKGADELAGRWAKARGIKCVVVRAEWDKYGKSAGHRRNVQMADMNPDLLLAFPTGGPGTRSMIEIAEKKGIECFIVIRI